MTINAEELRGRNIVDVIREPFEGHPTDQIIGLVLDDGSVIFALSDAEGNGAGALHYSAPPDPCDDNDHAGADLVI